VNLQPMHRVGVSVNVIWVTSQGPRVEHVAYTKLRRLRY